MTSISASGINTAHYHNERQPLWNMIVCTYVLVGYLNGVLLLFPVNWIYNIFGVFFLTHCLILSTYLTHEFIHGTIFAKMRWNRIGGTVMLWLNGGCYFQFQALAKKHIAHHIDRVDFATFDLASFTEGVTK
jgi:fatty acid desaturase